MGKDLIDSGFIRKLERLKLNSNVILNKGYSGARKSKSKGSSVEFSDYREYAPGDDFRKIDWNAYARFEKLFIKLFMEEREALVNVFLDASKSMDFGNPKKSLIAQQLALSMAYLSLSNMDRVNIFSNSDTGMSDSGYLNGKNTFHRLVNYIEKLKFDKKIDLFSYINNRPFKRGISLIISDLFTDNFEEAIKYLAYNKQSVIVIHTLSREEIHPRDTGDIRFIDSETNEAKDVSVTASILKSYEDTFNAYTTAIKEICNKYSCLYILVSNETSMEEIIFDSLIKAGILR
ncbi:MAG: DUF58 domain-containing protein [Firmicutes bacterium]|nr:DUF58 domain-containing protein [Bacillota bacterium]